MGDPETRAPQANKLATQSSQSEGFDTPFKAGTFPIRAPGHPIVANTGLFLVAQTPDVRDHAYSNSPLPAHCRLERAMLGQGRPFAVPGRLQHRIRYHGTAGLPGTGHSSQEMLARFDFGLVQAVGLMHSWVEPTGLALTAVAGVWTGLRFAYAHSGGWSMPHWHCDDIIAPDDYAEVAATWVADGVQAIGGCCGLGLLNTSMPW